MRIIVKLDLLDIGIDKMEETAARNQRIRQAKGSGRNRNGVSVSSTDTLWRPAEYYQANVLSAPAVVDLLF